MKRITITLTEDQAKDLYSLTYNDCTTRAQWLRMAQEGKFDWKEKSVLELEMSRI